jgi:molybdopterin-containing oxidoreductase family iron-sulfur binding subunit
MTLEARTREFAPGEDERPDGVERREFLRLLGAGAALAGIAGCERSPRTTIVPWVTQPPEAHPGSPRFYASAMEIDGYAIGLLGESHEGRPTKIEGNPEHPASLGATGLLAQASVLGAYDPDRVRSVEKRGEPASWGALRAVMAQIPDRGRGVHVILEPTGSPTIAAQISRLRAKFPELDVRWHAPLAPVNAWAGARIALGEPLETRVDLRAADVILALDSDFLSSGPWALVHQRDFAGRRTPATAADAMNRLYAVEPVMSVTGAAADHRLRVRARDVLAVAAAIARELAAIGVGISADLAGALAPWAARALEHEKWARVVARDLAAHRGASAVVVGETQPPVLHALAHAVNAALGNVGTSVTYSVSPIVDAGSEAFDLAPVSRALQAGQVKLLLVLGGNPAYTAPADLELAASIGNARESVYCGLYANETAGACVWHAPLAHWLESWGDARAFDGTASIVQPLLAPQAEARTKAELLDVLLGEPPRAPHDIVFASWAAARRDAATLFAAWLEKGLVDGTATPPLVPPPAPKALAIGRALAGLPLPNDGRSLELTFRRDTKVHDGAYANNVWLQELADTITQLTWDNAALLSRSTASRLGIADGDVVELGLGGRSLLVPALIVPGQADDSIAVSLGYGRQGGESVARGIGANAYALRTTGAPWFAGGATATATGRRAELALEQVHRSLEGRDDHVLLHETKDVWARGGGALTERKKPQLTLYEEMPQGPRQWGMAVDLSACTGCGACVVACQAENNVPSVGKLGVAKSRSMHWLRVDRYFAGAPDEPQVLLEPMMCQHCEKAPCEYVCPTNATTHSQDGLNQMIYNRCVGTRFCSNNCPYKVRRFNWFDYHQDQAPIVALVHNPDVTVRSRGVMEKCTYCVQRIREAEIREQVEGTPIVDGTVRSACEQACASGAIVFGDLRDEGSRVARLHASQRAFRVLDDLGTRPHTMYLARIRNPSPELA